ncbi:hypothetical protein C8034_v006825 [Colletotrichum sidae]|uniref:Uncharacterized protein n=1 Tax=Colletotrichum sidae TaxID=1347389 RepID=A0A4R8T4F1_9PEZI|nr:hypothetical protein C8034_v006825 [Colletotrichum sidae]
MSRSSFSIRRFISPRRSQTVEERRHSGDSTVSEDLNLFKRQPQRKHQEKSKSWAPSRNTSKVNASRTSREEALVRVGQNVQRASDEAIPLPEDSPNSSTSSLCSCGGTTDVAPTNDRDGPLCSPKQGRATRHSAPKRLADRRQLCIPPPPLRTKPLARPGASSTEADIKAFEAGHTDLAEHPAFRITETPPGTPENNDVAPWSLDFEDLIRETDEAFKAVGTAIEEAKVVVSSLPENSESNLRPTSVAFFQPGMQPPLPLWTKSSTADLHASNVTAPLPPPICSSSAPSTSRPRRTKSKKVKRTKSRSKKSARWQLGESLEDVADKLSGPFFRRIEVNELLSPDHFQALKAGREAQSNARKSSDTVRTVETDGSETPVEPFHLQDLPSRIGASGVGSVVAPAGMVSPSSTLDSAVRQGASVKGNTPSRTSSEAVDTEAKPDDSDGASETNTPLPPAENPLRLTPRPQVPPLPTIPELVVTIPEPPTTPKHAIRVFAPLDEDDFVFFQSTNYTFNHSTFQQGPIRFPKSDVVKGMKIDPDDTLDWTAFQMAIQGGAGDLFSDPSDFSQRSEAEEIADLVEWFEDFGFEHHGLLVSETAAKRSKRTRKSSKGDSPKSSISSGINLPIPVEYEKPSGFWDDAALNSSQFLTTACGIRRWTVERQGHPKRHNRESIDSLPPSPMMDLVMMKGVDGETEMVPMGYNLGHDLGDFLRWEAEHVYMTGVY